MNAAAGLCAFAAAALFGVAMTRCWRGVERALAATAVAYAGLASVLSWIGGIGALTHFGLLRFPRGPLLAAATLLLASGVGWRVVGRQSDQRDLRWPTPRRWEVAALTVPTAVLLVALVGRALHPPMGFDALSYHLPMAWALFHGGTLTAPVSFLHAQWHSGQPPGNFPLAYPGAAESVDGVLLQALGESWVWLPQAIAAAALAAAVGALAIRVGGRPWLPAAAALACPLVVFQAPSAYNDLLAVGCLIIAVVLATAPTFTVARAFVAAVALGAAVATKTVMIPVAVALLIVVAVRAVRHRPAALVGMVLLFVVPAFAWWVRDALVFHNPLFPVDVSVGPLHLRGLPSSTYGLAAQQRNFVPVSVAWPVYPLFEKYSDTSGFGALFVVIAVPSALLASLRPAVRRHPFWPTWMVSAVVSLVVAVLFPLPTPRFQLLPVLLTFVFCGLPATGWSTYDRAVAVLAVVAVIVTGAVVIDRLRASLTEPLDRSKFYAEVGYVEPPAAALGEGARVWDDVSWSDFGFAAVYALTGPGHDQSVFVGSLGGVPPAQACAALPRHVGYVYVVADRAVPVAQVMATYGEPLFHEILTVSRRGVHGVQRRSLFVVTPACAALSGAGPAAHR